ncbi:MAG: response regulator [Bacteroidales bacterium]|nr:response regulator [Bacteroidales bacterium]MBN2820985.1 response regulator [Bacteroidales bacterium]
MFYKTSSKYVLFVILLIFITASTTKAQSTYYRFRYLTQENGLKNSSIHTICQDDNGFIWIGTEGGLFRYDGFRFKHFTHNPNDTNSLNSPVVFALFSQANNKLWIGTYRGLMLYDPTLNRFTDLNLSERYLPGKTIPVNDIVMGPDSLIYIACQEIGVVVYNTKEKKFDDILSDRINRNMSNSAINTIMFDSKNNCWIGTYSKGIYKFGPDTNQPVYYDFSSYSDGKLNTNDILKITETTCGDIWVTTRGGGVFLFVKGENNIKHFHHNAEVPGSIGSNEAYDTWENTNNEIWISTNGGGINIYNKNTESFTRIKHKPNDRYGLLNDNIRTIFEDQQGNLWITSFQYGINIKVNNPYKFNHVFFPPEENTEYRSTTILSFYTDEKNLWVGTDGGGLKNIDKKTGAIKTYLPSQTMNSIPDRVITAIQKDYQGILWLGTYLQGLVIFDTKTGKFRNFTHDADNKKSISNNYVSCIVEDRNGNLWIGTNGGGINLLNRHDYSFKHFMASENDPENSLVHNYVNVIQEDINGNLWIGTYWGLSHFNIRDYSFKNYRYSRNKTGSLSNNVVLSLLRDSKGRLWVGTRMGLNLYNRDNDNFVIYTENDGLAASTINGILEDKQGNIWISTNSGISKFNPQTEESVNFYAEDGLQGNEFYHGACYKSSNGDLFFGGYNGFNAFNPDSIAERHYMPKVILTGLRVLDRDIPIGSMPDGREILKKDISETDKIELNYSDKSISVYFAAIDFIEGSKNIFAYKLENFDNSWNYTTQEHPFATYTNLSPGTYTFLVKAGKKEILNEVPGYAKLQITINPPLWRTWWAYTLYLLFVLFFIFFFWRLSLQRLKEKNQIKLEKLKREQIETATQARMSFYTNISHDIRTPLTLIIGPLEQLLSRGKETEPFRKQLDIMLKNARRLLRLINQLLDFRKIEMDKMSLNAEKADLNRFIRDIVYSFEEFAAEKHIEFKFKSNIDKCILWFDPDKIDKAMFNLLSNAFKYTPDKGRISVELNSPVKISGFDSQFAEISITDSGKGIAAQEINNIFDRFYQVNNQQNTTHKGWGLGLNLSKNYIELHKGTIKVESIENAGSVFKIYLPLDESIFDENEKVQTTIPGVNKYLHIASDAYKDNSKKNTVRSKTKNNAFQALIVEDNLELRDYLVDELSTRYNCYEANNGLEGYELAVDLMPDIVISDIMMPGMDGYQLCKYLKENIVTSHIPVILLTAKSSTEDQIEGLESGADAYISKPFRPDQLIASIESIIDNRIRLKEKFSKLNSYTSNNKNVTADDKFINKAQSVIIDNVSNNQFGVNELAQHLTISRVHLHRKMKAIADLGPNDFIRKIRLQKAAELLLKNENTISEICSMVGFSSTTYFSSCFKAYYKLSPKEFIDKERRK